MKTGLRVYNTYTRKLEVFVPKHPKQVSLYLCGPTVYGEAHLGHARSAVTFDVMVRYLRHLGYGVCYVRNITDVGHLTGEGEDKVMRVAKVDKVNPMEIAQRYTDGYEADMARLNVEKPSIVPRATGHIPAQISLVETLLEKGWAYVVNGSVYFDLTAYEKQHPYGKLSGRKSAELVSGTRRLTQAEEKRDRRDFALWKRAAPNHLMRWVSPWGEGFPGWHLECTAMSQKYLGTSFDIHGGGLDLCFPHHECEIAQAVAATGVMPARYWLHNNLVTIDQQKMSKSANNFITLSQCFTGDHPLLSEAYSPMVLRFFLLQAHYRSPISFSDTALQAAKKGYYKLMNGLLTLQRIAEMDDLSVGKADNDLSQHLAELCQGCDETMDTDFNTAQTIAQLFALRKIINQLYGDGQLRSSLAQKSWERLERTYRTFATKVLGLEEHHPIKTTALLKGLITQYLHAKQRGDDAQVGAIRQVFQGEGLSLQDYPSGVEWSYII